jgi:uncharacterized protein with HEPN domain
VTRDEVFRLRDIHEALELIQSYARRAGAYPEGRDDAFLQDAVLFRLAVIGEAVKSLPHETTGKAPEIDWSAWAGLRDVISHSYFRVDMAIIWATVDSDVPKLAAAIDRLLADVS